MSVVVEELHGIDGSVYQVVLAGQGWQGACWPSRSRTLLP